MAEPNQDPGATPAPADPSPNPPPEPPHAPPEPAPEPQATNGAKVDLTSEQLKQRLAEERERARQRLLKELGFEKPDELKTRLQKAKELEDAQLSEQERLQNRINELEPEAQRASKLQERFAKMVDEQVKSLSETHQRIVEERAGDDPDKRLEVMQILKEASAGAEPAPSGDTPPKPKPAPATVAPGTPPQPSQPRTKFEEWQQLRQKNGLMADIFYRSNVRDIEATRPAES